MDANGKFTLEKGKLVLKDGSPVAASATTTTTTKKKDTAAEEEDEDNEDGEDVPVLPESPTPAPKKRGRPPGSTTKKSAKKAKNTKDAEKVDAGDE